MENLSALSQIAGTHVGFHWLANAVSRTIDFELTVVIPQKCHRV